MTTTRRRFLAAAAPLIAPASALGQTPPSGRMTIGFIGTGNNGYGYLMPFLRDPRVRVVAVCDVNREGPGYWDGTVRGWAPAKRLVDGYYGDEGCATYTDYRELLQRRDIDAVYLGTPDHWHALNTIHAARAGKHIYGQKPLSLTVRDGRRMVQAVEKAKVVWQTGSQQRSDIYMRRAVELVRNGAIGKVHTVRVGLPGGTPDFGHTANQTTVVPVPDGFDFDFWLGPAPAAQYCPARVGVNFRWVKDYSGGQLTDWGAHHIDIAQLGLAMERSGPVALRNARGEWAKHPVYNTATEYSFECEYANGVKMIVGTKERGGVRFEGADGWVWTNRSRLETSSPDIATASLPTDGYRMAYSRDHEKNFIDAVLNGVPVVAPIEEAHRTITVSHLGNIALEVGRDLKWDPARESITGDDTAAGMLDRQYRRPWNPEG
ncbi:MAG: Gfo/Idh/MocA family oxidoreductase [Bryobacteraceae bacterium]|nr:Gfo/Idh/MocA family oxidoreductase [Solibacteraceae bacterium]MCO5351918.1 Gfo/Idh/MocA family oxidoreductase [Bryobacteraceae bacterium]